MNKKVIYKGVNSYNDKKQNSKSRANSYLMIIFLSVFIVSVILGLKMFKVSDREESKLDRSILSDNKMLYYIDISDKIGKDKAVINWREIAAINEVLNEGNEDELVPKIAEVFLKNDINEGYTVFTIEEVLSILKVNSKEEEKIMAYLEEIEENTLFKELYEDEVKRTFINEIEDSARLNYDKYGVLPSITMAQAILESGWGQSELATEHNNLFGIKADSRWDGEVATIITKENYDDTIQANFRKYDNLQESIEDHGEFLFKSTRYRENGFFEGKEYISQAQALEDAGYSTSKNKNGEKDYADKLINLIQRYNLMVYDSQVKEN